MQFKKPKWPLLLFVHSSNTTCSTYLCVRDSVIFAFC